MAEHSGNEEGAKKDQRKSKERSKKEQGTRYDYETANGCRKVVKMKRIQVMICVLAMVFSLTACGGNTKTDGTADSSSTAGTDNSSQTPDAKDTDAGTGEAIRFAVCGPMTGDSAEQGLLQMNGCQMAVDEINAAGGVNGRQLDMVCYDDQASPNQAVIVAEKIAADPTIEFVISHINSGCTIAAQDVYILSLIHI